MELLQLLLQVHNSLLDPLLRFVPLLFPLDAVYFVLEGDQAFLQVLDEHVFIKQLLLHAFYFLQGWRFLGRLLDSLLVQVCLLRGKCLVLMELIHVLNGLSELESGCSSAREELFIIIGHNFDFLFMLRHSGLWLLWINQAGHISIIGSLSSLCHAYVVILEYLLFEQFLSINSAFTLTDTGHMYLFLRVRPTAARA